ncbi:MAG: YitT family protein [Lachnospiraceae bacterium]|nr:YitT family protein [Lachnospiraceae bacterium]
MKNKYNAREFILDILSDIVGSILYGIGIVYLFTPANLAPGGVTGIAIMLNYIFGWGIGITTLCLNIPIMIMALTTMGRSFTVKSIKSIIISSAILYIMENYPIFHIEADILLSAIFGGILMGAGLVIIFMRGSTTGGTDIISFVIKHFFPSLPVGKIMLVADGIIVFSSIFVFGELKSGLYAVIAIFCSTRSIDSILYGLDKGTMMTVVSEKSHEIGDRILHEMDRGVTFLKGYGGYTGNQQDVLMCVVRRQEYGKIRDLVMQTDPHAFVIVGETTAVLGEGFKSYTQ